MNKSISEQLDEVYEEIVQINAPTAPPCWQKIYEEKVKYVLQYSGIDEELLGKKDDVKPLYKGGK